MPADCPTCPACVELRVLVDVRTTSRDDARRERDEARARADALQARLDALTAPVEGVDVEEVLADADALSEAIEGGDHYERDALRERIVDAAPALAREVVALRAALATAKGELD